MEFRFHHLLSYSTLLLLFAAIPSFAQSKLKPIDASAATPQAEVFLLGTYR